MCFALNTINIDVKIYKIYTFNSLFGIKIIMYLFYIHVDYVVPKEILM